MVLSIPNKALKQENLQLAVFTAFNILANLCGLPPVNNKKPKTKKLMHTYVRALH